MNRINHVLRRSLMLAGAVLLGLSFAQQETLSVDEAVILTGLQGDAYEILSSELALERSGSDSVQQFAQLMIDDHTQTSERLQELAGNLGFEAEFVASPAQGLKLARLRQLEGDQFDVEYLAQQRMAHQAALVNYSIGAELAEDEEIARFASETAATITEHLRLLDDMMMELGIMDPYDSFLQSPGPAAPQQVPEGEIQEQEPDQEQFEDEPEQEQQDEQQQDEQQQDGENQNDQPEEEQPEEEPVDQDAQDDL